jgi:hypothetical protein
LSLLQRFRLRSSGRDFTVATCSPNIISSTSFHVWYILPIRRGVWKRAVIRYRCIWMKEKHPFESETRTILQSEWTKVFVQTRKMAAVSHNTKGTSCPTRRNIIEKKLSWKAQLYKYLYFSQYNGSRGILYSIVSDHGLDYRAIRVRSPAAVADFSSNFCPDRLWGHPASYPMGNVSPFPWVIARQVRDADHFPHPCRGKEWVRAIFPLPTNAFVACSGTALLP